MEAFKAIIKDDEGNILDQCVVVGFDGADETAIVVVSRPGDRKGLIQFVNIANLEVILHRSGFPATDK
jgi:hypothetical protein